MIECNQEIPANIYIGNTDQLSHWKYQLVNIPLEILTTQPHVTNETSHPKYRPKITPVDESTIKTSESDSWEQQKNKLLLHKK